MRQDWTFLPFDLLKLISEKITSISDFVRFRGVCTAWRSASTSRPRHLPPQLPWLMIPGNLDGEEDDFGSSLSLYDLSESRTHILDLPEIQRKRIGGSSNRWLVLEKEREVWSFNPITRDQITPPSLSAQPNSFVGTLLGDNLKDEVLDCPHNFCITNAILSSNPDTDPRCLVKALFQGSWETAFCRIDDDYWTTITVEADIGHMDPPLHVVDINYRNDLFYAFCSNGQAWIYNISNPSFNNTTSAIGDYHDQEVDYICTVEGGCNEQGLMALSQDNAYYPTHNPLNMCSILMFF